MKRGPSPGRCLLLRLVLVAAFIGVVAEGFGQTPPRAQVLADLASANWQTRWRAAAALDRNGSLLKNTEIQRALVAAYLRGYAEARARQLGESREWQAYNLAITGAVLRMKRCCNAAFAATALVEGADYDPEEAHGRELAADPAAYPALFAAASRPPRADGRPDYGRANAFVVLAIAYAFARGRPVSDGGWDLHPGPAVRLSAAQLGTIVRLVTAAAKRPGDPDRPSALNALGILGTRAAWAYLFSLAGGHGLLGGSAASALDRWYSTREIVLPYPGTECAWLPSHPAAFSHAMLLEQSRAASRTNAPTTLAVMFALASGRMAPTKRGWTIAADPTYLPRPGPPLACRVPSFRLSRAQLSSARKIVMAAARAADPFVRMFAYRNVGILGDSGSRRFLAAAVRSPDRWERFDAERGLRFWALTNGRPLPVFQAPRQRRSAAKYPGS